MLQIIVISDIFAIFVAMNDVVNSSASACPILYIIAGCNGAGKTSASLEILPEILDCDEFVNADEIAKGLSPFKPESVAIEAGKLMLKRIDELVSQGATFAIETTLATRSYSNLIKKVHNLGYRVNLLFFWLESPEFAKERVKKRVLSGGHDIPIDTIYRRYKAGIINLFEIFMPIVDSWILYDNTNGEIEFIASDREISNSIIYDKLKRYVRERT